MFTASINSELLELSGFSAGWEGCNWSAAHLILDVCLHCRDIQGCSSTQADQHGWLQQHCLVSMLCDSWYCVPWSADPLPRGVGGVFPLEDAVLSLKPSLPCGHREHPSAGEGIMPSSSHGEGPVCPDRYSPSAGGRTSVQEILSIPRSSALMPFPTAAL